MPHIAPAPLTQLSAALLHKAGLPENQARKAADHLVEANLMGHDSHGVIRVPNYVKSIQAGTIRAVGAQVVERESATMAVMDARGSMGIVLAYDAMNLAVNKCLEHDLGAVAVHSASHIGRLGAFPPLAAARNCIGFIMLNGGGRFAAPFGGTERRLPPNPVAIAVPTASGYPMMLDITTSMVAGGKVEVLAARDQAVPEGWLIDTEGNSVTDPHSFRRPNVAMLPLGGALGHKGYGLSMMIDAIAGTLSRAGCSRDAPTRGGSGFLCLAIRIESFVDLDEYQQELQFLVDWVKSSRAAPGSDGIYLPGELEEIRKQEREARGIPIEDKTWERLTAAAQELSVPMPSV